MQRIELPSLLLIGQTDSTPFFSLQPRFPILASRIDPVKRQPRCVNEPRPESPRRRRVPGAPEARLRWTFRLLF